MTLTLPTILTLFRILLLPVIVVLFYLPEAWARPAAALVFVVAGATDWLDGYLARRLGQESPFGAFLDPVADKLMVATVLVMVVEEHASIWLTLPAIVIIGREIAISALREWMAQVGQRAKVAVSWVGKVKTTAQLLALLLLLYNRPIEGISVFEIGMVSLYIAALLTVWSMASYLKAAFSE